MKALLFVLLKVEDEQEKIDRLQMALLLENPDSAAFYNAKMRTQRRVSCDTFGSKVYVDKNRVLILKSIIKKKIKGKEANCIKPQFSIV